MLYILSGSKALLYVWRGTGPQSGLNGPIGLSLISLFPEWGAKFPLLLDRPLVDAIAPLQHRGTIPNNQPR